MKNLKELKQELRKLRKEKEKTKAYTKGREKINKKILVISKEISFMEKCGEEKAKLIYKILDVMPHINDLSKFTIEELEFHYKKITGRV